MVISPKKTILPAHLCTITNGPSKYDFQASLFDKKIVKLSIDETPLEQRTLHSMNISKVFYVTFSLVGREDGSTESWIGKCTITEMNNQKHSEERIFYYSTKTRKGTIFEKTKTWNMN